MFVGLFMPENKEKKEKKKKKKSKIGTLGVKIGERKFVVNMAY